MMTSFICSFGDDKLHLKENSYNMNKVKDLSQQYAAEG